MTGLTITSSQLKSFEAARLEDFRKGMVELLREDVGGRFKDQSDKQLLSYIDNGTKRAKAHGATENDAFAMFIMLMAELGDDFDTNKDFPWAQRGLANKAVKDPNARIENVVVECAFYLSNLGEEADGKTPTPPQLT